MKIELVYEFEGCDAPACILTRGHVDKSQFVSETKRQHEIDVPVERVAHGYMRNVPTGVKGEWTLQDAVKGRGAFSVTYIDIL